MPLLEKFNVVHNSSRNKRHATPLRASGGIPALGYEAQARSKGKATVTGFLDSKGKVARQGSVNDLGLTGLNNFCELFSTCLVPGHGMI